MSDDADEALLFVYGTGGKYFRDVVEALRLELAVSDPAQAAALERLVVRCRDMRQLLEQRLPGGQAPDHPPAAPAVTGPPEPQAGEAGRSGAID